MLSQNPDLIRIGNCSGFYGDRISAMKEMLEGGELDVLTGDYLAELTMLILGKDRMRDQSLGYAKTFLKQVEECMGLALEKNVQIVANAGGLNTAGLAAKLQEVADKLGLAPKIAYVEGDNIIDKAADLGFAGSLTANAYLGGWGIVECLNAGADIVVTGRVTDAAVIVGPAAAHFGWSRTDYDALAGAVVAGHIIECGTQATGGNYSFFTEINGGMIGRPGFPYADIRRDGSFVIGKHEGTGGAVTVDTVKSQLMYEIQGTRYANPDVTTRLDSFSVTQEGQDRVLVSGVKGEAPPPQLKVSLNSFGGFRNEMTLILTGLDIEKKAELAISQFREWLPMQPAELSTELVRLDRPNAETEEQGSALLRLVARDPDPDKIGKPFSAVAVELALASYPGCTFTAPPGNASPYGFFTPGYVDRDKVSHIAVLPDGTRIDVANVQDTQPLDDVVEPSLPEFSFDGATKTVPLGTIALARSGDKGGNANIGVWVRTEEQWAWLANELTTEKLRELLPEAKSLNISRTVLPNLRALNFVIEGILGKGVAEQVRFDPQAKGLGEWLRSRHIEIPEALL
ncbi:MAG: DUF1446 domain-containing protein [Nocardiaceae bacterium]|nr:DUF1446 domain-containing protein [Nocardiaceae bacterium]